MICGIDNWAEGVSVDVSDCADVLGDLTLPSMQYDIYRLDGDTLLTGAESGDSPEARPTVFDPDESFTRVGAS